MFASGLTVLLMLGVAVYVVIEALGRIGETVTVVLALFLDCCGGSTALL